MTDERTFKEYSIPQKLLNEMYFQKPKVDEPGSQVCTLYRARWIDVCRSSSTLAFDVEGHYDPVNPVKNTPQVVLTIYARGLYSSKYYDPSNPLIK